MIDSYKIVNDNGSEVLYLYLNYEYEFASFFDKRKINNVKDYIIHFISDKKIKFNGNKAILILNGIIISSIFLGNNFDYKTSNNLNNYKYVVYNENLFKNNNQINTNIVKEQPSALNEELKSVETNTNNENTNFKINNVSESREPSLVTEKIETTKEVTAEKNVSTVSGVQETQESETQVQNPPQIVEEVKKEKMVNVVRSNGTILNISLEDYVIGVVGAEMPASFNVEALKSQAVIARTYALRRVVEGKSLTDTTINQVYKDNNQLLSVWGGDFNKYYNKIVNAVESTKGEVIKYNGKYVDAVYHSTSNGITEDPLFVWGYTIPYLKSVDSHWDLNASSYLRSVFYTTNDFSTLLCMDINNDTPINVIDRSNSNRINNIQIGDKIINGVELYNLLGLRSRDFEIVIDNSIVTITTKGYGHGVGLSQYGANGMANEGYNYKQIINHYYNNINIVKEDL